jgi:hypothetical protein
MPILFMAVIVVALPVIALMACTVPWFVAVWHRL